MIPIEKLLIDWLPTQINGVRFAGESPANLQDVVPFVRVYATGGPRDFKMAKPTVLFECFTARDRTTGVGSYDALLLAEAVTTTLLDRRLLPTLVDGQVLAALSCISSPIRLPYANPSVAMAQCTFVLAAH